MKQIEQRKLANGSVLTVYDLSRNIAAADRWLVKIRCEISIPVREDFFAAQEEQDIELQSEVRAQMGDALVFASEQERNFIDASEKDQVLQMHVEQMLAAMLLYLENPKFSEKFFNKRYAELKESCLTARHYRQRKVSDDDDEGPADFSACFRNNP